MAGKWHVGGDYAVHLPETWKNAGDATHPLPRQRGFDRFYGMLCGAGSYFNPPTLMRDGSFIEPEGDDYYITDAITDEALRMLGEREREGEDKSFFLYLAYTAPHWPLHAKSEDIEKYRGHYKIGWEALRRERHERLRESGILDRDWELSPRDEHAAPWDEADHKDWEDLRMAVYVAQVDNPRATPIFWEHEGNRAVRKGPWKLVSRHPGQWELYNMDSDRTELHDLATTHGEILKQMVALYQGWAERCGVQDWETVRSGRLKSA